MRRNPKTNKPRNLSKSSCILALVETNNGYFPGRFWTRYNVHAVYFGRFDFTAANFDSLTFSMSIGQTLRVYGKPVRARQVCPAIYQYRTTISGFDREIKKTLKFFVILLGCNSRLQIYSVFFIGLSILVNK